MKYAGFVIDASVDEIDVVRQKYDALRYDDSTMVLTIAPTLACNFGCDYCFQGADKPLSRMSPEVEQATLALVNDQVHQIRRLHVAWYGGEPLMGLPIIERLSLGFTGICDPSGVAYDASIVTNGYKLDGRTAKRLTDLRVRTAQITLDGPREYHDRRRALLSGRGTFDRILDNIAASLSESPIAISIRVNVDQRNSTDIPSLLDTLAARKYDPRRFSVYFAPVEAITSDCRGVTHACMSKSSYARLETQLQQYAAELGLCRPGLPSRFRGLCAAVRPKGIVIAPNGDIHKCWDTISMPLLRVATVENPSPALERKNNEWVEWSPFENQVCRSCKLLPNCTGSCAHKFINPDETSGEAASLPCPSWKFDARERFVAIAIQSGVISFDDVEGCDLSTDPAELSELQHGPETVRAQRKLLPLVVIS
jgi:uncharacterized protein